MPRALSGCMWGKLCARPSEPPKRRSGREHVGAGVGTVDVDRADVCGCVCVVDVS